MAADDAGEKTEQPTARRLSEAREQGQVPRSHDLTAAAGLCGAILLFKIFGLRIFQRMIDLTGTLGDAPDTSGVQLKRWISAALESAAWMIVPFLLLLLAMTVLATLVQSRPVLAWKKLVPSLNKLNPVNGVKRLFSSESLMRVAMGVLKMAFVATIAYTTIRGQIGPVLTSGAVMPNGVFDLACHVMYVLALRLVLALLVLALIDYFYQRWKLNKSLKMTKQEVRDEFKRMEGDPQMKGRRRRIQANLAMQRINRDVPRADVVVTNPTEFAVALKYDEATMGAPRVVAKGADFLALRIRQVAQQHGIPIVQRPPLARAIFASVEVGHEVPPQYYRAVAEVLAYVYRISGKASA